MGSRQELVYHSKCVRRLLTKRDSAFAKLCKETRIDPLMDMVSY